VVVVFTVRPNNAHAVLVGFATGLLVLGLISSLAGAFNFAAIGAERKLTPNLVAATMYSGAGAAVGVIAILSAFVVLAKVYLPDSTSLFAMITVGAAILGSAFVAAILGDAWVAFPETSDRQEWWLADQNTGGNAALIYAGFMIVTVAVASALYFTDSRIRLTPDGIRWLIGGGIALVTLLNLGATVRTIHRVTPAHRWGLRRFEARILLGTMAGYLAVVIVCLP
jgi:hypothetical protein